MKYYIFYTLLVLMPLSTVCSAQAADSATISRIIERNNKSLLNAVQAQNKPVTDTTAKNGNTIVKPATTVGSKAVQDIITFLPVAFFSVLVSMIFFKLRKDGVKLSEILIDKEAVAERKKAVAAAAAKTLETKADVIKSNPQAFTSPDQVTAATDALNQPAADTAEADTQKSQSTSRLIVFICGITSIALACCICTFYFYKSFTGTEKVDLGNLTNVLYGLGLGVLPYGFNKIAAALK